MPEKDIARLQRVQNCLARVVTKAPRFSRSVPILKRLHWLPVKFRIHFKICAIICARAFSISGPALWNALPVPIGNAKTILTFRKVVLNPTYLTWLFHPSPSAARLPVDEPALASIKTH